MRDYFTGRLMIIKPSSVSTKKDRLVYHIENIRIYIAHCKGHYDN